MCVCVCVCVCVKSFMNFLSRPRAIRPHSFHPVHTLLSPNTHVSFFFFTNDLGEAFPDPSQVPWWEKEPGWKYYSWAIQHGFEYDKFWETVKDRGAWCTAVHRVAKSQTWLRNWTTATTLLVRVDKHQDLLEEMYFLGSDFSRVACGVCCLSAVLGPF